MGLLIRFLMVAVVASSVLISGAARRPDRSMARVTAADS